MLSRGLCTEIEDNFEEGFFIYGTVMLCKKGRTGQGQKMES